MLTKQDVLYRIEELENLPSSNWYTPVNTQEVDDWKYVLDQLKWVDFNAYTLEDLEKFRHEIDGVTYYIFPTEEKPTGEYLIDLDGNAVITAGNVTIRVKIEKKGMV